MFDDDQDAYDWITYGASKAKSSNENKKVIHKSVTK